MNKFPDCHVFDGQVVRAAAPGIGETCDRILFVSLYNQKYFPLHGEDKFPLWEGYIFESKIPLVVRIGLAARACGSGIGPSPSNSVPFHAKFHSFLCYKTFLYFKVLTLFDLLDTWANRLDCYVDAKLLYITGLCCHKLLLNVNTVRL